VNIALTAQALAQAIAAGGLTASIRLAANASATVTAGGSMTTVSATVIPAARVLSRATQTTYRGTRRVRAIQTTRR